MPTLETITKADLSGPLNSKSLNRARGYIHRVQNPARSGHTLTAQVRGSWLYEVEIDVEPGGISAICSCPYDWGGYCKHVGAVLLKWIQSPGDFADEGAAALVSGEYPIEVIPVEPPPTQQPAQPPFWLASPFAERLRTDEEQLHQWLNGVKLQDLRRMAKQRGWKVKGTRKADIVRQISERIADPSGILKATRDLDEEHRRVLRALVLLGAGGRIRPEELGDVTGAWGELESYQNVSTYTRHLWEMGLALPGDVLDSYHERSDFVPRAIGRALPPVLKNVVPTASHPQSNVGEICLADPRPFIRAVNQVVLLLEQYPTPLRPPMPRPRMERFYPGLKGWDYDPRELAQAKSSGKLGSYDTAITVPPPARSLPDETIERLSPVAGDEARLEFIYSLLVAAGVLQPGSPVTIWPEVKEQFLRQSELAQRAILTQIYFRMLNWSALWELLRESDLRLWRFSSHSHLEPNDLRNKLALFRHIAMRALASLPDGEWVALQDLFRLMRAVWPRFDHSVWQDYWRPSLKPSWFLGSKSGLSLDPEDASDWELAQGRFIRQIIAGPLHWLGLADLCFDDGTLTAARFHGLADLYWDRVETPDAPPAVAAQAPAVPPEEAIDTDSHTISVAPSAIPPQAHDLLNKIARLETATAERFVYRLDSQATYESFETGVALSELFDGWEQSLPIPMPEAIRDQLTAWWDAYGRVRIYESLTVVEFGDDYALVEMKAVTPLKQFIIAEISPRLVIIPQEAVAPLTEALEKAGYTPKQTDEV
ncbi:MAG: hypothetical protein KKC18_01625 [Chloroflexi bacterium]|nr:hypothetical protein [Chloroflexota bacterium]